MATFVAILAEGFDPLVVVAAKMAGGVNSFAILAIPFFILSGHLMGRGRMARRQRQLDAMVASWTEEVSSRKTTFATTFGVVLFTLQQ